MFCAFVNAAQRWFTYEAEVEYQNGQLLEAEPHIKSQPSLKMTAFYANIPSVGKYL